MPDKSPAASPIESGSIEELATIIGCERALAIVASAREEVIAERDRMKDALLLIRRCVRNSREAPNVLDTIDYAAREALK